MQGTNSEADVVVIGAGTVGAAIAYGLAGLGQRVVVLDGGDRDFRAAVANFGLIWEQGKGIEVPGYRILTHGSLERWPEFCAVLEDETGIDLHYDRSGGLMLAMSEADFERVSAMQARLRAELGEQMPPWEMLDRAALQALMPKVRLGKDIVGSSYGRDDGHVNPLRLLAALHAGIVKRGGSLCGQAVVSAITSDRQGGLRIDYRGGSVSAGRVVIAAGLGSKALAAQVGLDIPLRAQRGQILVTERIEPFLPLPMSGLRQTREGSVLIGLTHEEVGLDASTTVAAAAALSANAIRRLPGLGEAKLVRQWSGLRIMTPDGHPIYAESSSHPGVFVALCHSGITLAAAHSGMFAQSIAQGCLPSALDVFHHRRFDVSQAA
ncbi:NAD(P)/FAD-dependent oxidoreductase [Sphingomonas crocodyli]|uniref:FAD-binding oxidoreductase n=1 Tax=Sphingomonas crocodyli TaxID=1979270 RepID=A0A437M725_9SPHN|nr:FAD-dependent oxidoreductase [Sphingomonas crocodyli]RVT93520.1 FAD-binding oxidoreductase [Sphingomonas crocodyli]